MLAEHNPAGVIKAGAHLLGGGPAGLRQTAAARGRGLSGAIAHPVAEVFFGLPDGPPGHQGTQQQHHQRPDDAPAMVVAGSSVPVLTALIMVQP